MRLTLLGGLCLVLVTATGCSSGLKYVIDGQFLGDVGPEEKREIFEAQGAVFRAEDEIYRARYQAALTQKEIEVAGHEYDAAKVELDSAKAEKEFAVTTQDQNKIVPAETKVEVARLAIDAAALKRDAMQAKAAYAAEQEALIEKKILVKQAKVEQAKVQLIVAKGKKPSTDFDPKVYEQQLADLQQDYEAAKMEVDKKKAAVTEAENAYNDAKRALEAKTSPAPAKPAVMPSNAVQPPPATEPEPEPAPTATEPPPPPPPAAGDPATNP